MNLKMKYDILRCNLDSTSTFTFSTLCVFGFFFFFQSRSCWHFNCEQCTCALFTDPQTPLFINFFIKNGFHSIIHTFKNYFATVFSVFSFQFQQNKFYPNKPLKWNFYTLFEFKYSALVLLNIYNYRSLLFLLHHVQLMLRVF